MDIVKIRSKPKARRGVYELYWRFASRRQAAFEHRLAGKNASWSDDPILREFKFCNVYRAADRVSQYMTRDVRYAEEAGTPADRAFQIVAFRTFSKISTWDRLIALLGRSPRIPDLADGSFVAALNRIKREEGVSILEPSYCVRQRPSGTTRSIIITPPCLRKCLCRTPLRIG